MLILPTTDLILLQLMGKIRINIGKEIRDELQRQGRSVQWLSEQLDCNRTNTYNIFLRESISTELLLGISMALNKDFFALYSQYLQELDN